MPDQRSRYRGSLLGLATGDALGTTLEFRAPGTFEPLTDMTGGGPFALAAGEWTDDTSMALCLATSLAECGEFDADDQMQRYVRWWREGYLSSRDNCFDIGMTTASALLSYERTSEPYSGSTDPFSAGNGSLMRLAPVPLFFAGSPMEALEMSGESSRTTHGAIEAVDSCRYFGGLIVGAVQGVDRQELLSPMFSPAPGSWDSRPLAPGAAEVAAGSFKHREPPEIQGAGYVVRALEAALWAFHNSDSFEEGCLEAANLGDDADTTAAIYGQLAGAYYGEDGIPARWLRILHDREHISELAEALLAHSQS